MKRLAMGWVGLVLVAGVAVCRGEGGTNVVQAKVGQEFEVKLEANHTTGYRWDLVKPVDTNAVKLVSESYSSKVKGRVGAGGEETWRFKALKAGETPIGFKHVRPWETNAVPGKTTNFLVKVEKGS
jgi:inhibitor of cysteine peptidase